MGVANESAEAEEGDDDRIDVEMSDVEPDMDLELELADSMQEDADSEVAAEKRGFWSNIKHSASKVGWWAVETSTYVASTTAHVLQKLGSGLVTLVGAIAREFNTFVVTRLTPEFVLIGLLGSQTFNDALTEFLLHTPFVELLFWNTDVITAGVCGMLA